MMEQCTARRAKPTPTMLSLTLLLTLPVAMVVAVLLLLLRKAPRRLLRRRTRLRRVGFSERPCRQGLVRLPAVSSLFILCCSSL